MHNLVLENYLLIKALHIIAVMAWMCGLLYLPRLFVYHTGCKVGSETYQTFLLMEYRLIRYIMTPSLVSSLIFGTLLLYAQSDNMGWLHVKFLGLLMLFASHGMMVRYHKSFKNNQNEKSARFFRIFNEVPTLLMIVIVIMAVMKPF